MGYVYKAQHRRMKRIVALKVLPSAVAKLPAAIKRFEREVEAAAKLPHPHIVTAYDADEADGIHFLVMEYVDGTDLANLVRRDGPLPVARAMDYVLQAAKYLSRNNFVGRNLFRPSGLKSALRTNRGVDFGHVLRGWSSRVAIRSSTGISSPPIW
jgi:serine/threonine protein kinase